MRGPHRPIVGCPMPTSRGMRPKLKRRMNPNTTKICWIRFSISDMELPVAPDTGTLNENNGTKNAIDVLRDCVEKNLGLSMLWSLVSLLSLMRSCWEWDLWWRRTKSSSHQARQLEPSQQMRNQSFLHCTRTRTSHIFFSLNFLTLLWFLLFLQSSLLALQNFVQPRN